MPTTHNALVGYAVLRANYNADAPNYLDNFSNFVVEVLVRHHPEALQAHQISDEIKSSFGLVLPTFVVEKILQGARRRQLVSGDRTAYSPTQTALRGAQSISANIERYARQQAELTLRLQAFIHANYPENNALLEADLAAELAAYYEANAIPLLRQSLKGTRQPDRDQSAGFEYVISRFIAEIGREDSLAFSYIEDAAKGAILAAVVDLDTSSFAQSLKSVAVYLDTPVLIDLLGFHGEVSANAMRQLTQLARQLGARIYVFEHSVRELEGVLHTAEGFLRGSRSSTTIPRTVLHFRDSSLSAADVAVARESLDTKLAELRVFIKDRPATYAQYGLDEGELEDALASAIHYRNPSARRNDVDSISAIHRLREGRSSNKLERCGYVMVTNNNELTRAASRFESERHLWPLLMTEVALASLMWIRSSAVDDDLPRTFLLATAYAGMQPDGHLWHKYLDEVDALELRGVVNPEDALILRTTNAAQSALMEETLGSAEVLNAEDVLHRLKQDLAKPLQDEIAAASARERAALENAKQSKTEVLEKDEALKSLITELDRRTAREHNRESQIRVRADKRARLVIGAWTFMAALLIGGFAGASTYWNVDGVPIWLRITCIAAAVLTGVLAVGTAVAPNFLPQLISPLKDQLARKYIQKVRSAASLDT
jgi:hypothetical protein